MAYNNGFPVGYQYFNPQIQQPIPQQPQQNNSLIWVQGEAGAKSYLVAPNNTVQLWDSEAPVIYLKSADASGMPSMRIIDYTFREQAKALEAPKVDYVTHDELKALEEKLTIKFDEMKGDTGA